MGLATSEVDAPSLLERLDARFPQTVVALPSGAQATVRTAGDPAAPAVVLLHGIGSGAASWLGVAEALCVRARVIAWDAPGYGASSAVGRSMGSAEGDDPSTVPYTDRLDALLDALEVDGCRLVGHSLGALIATAYAAGRGAARVRRLVLLSPAAGYGAPDRAAEREQVRAKRLGTLQTAGIPGIAADAPRRMLTDAASDEARAWVRWNASRLNAAGYARAVDLLCDADIGRAAGRLAMPCEVHCGEHDSVTPPPACRAVAERLGASYASIPNAGHASPVERPVDVARRIADEAPIPSIPGSESRTALAHPAAAPRP